MIEPNDAVKIVIDAAPVLPSEVRPIESVAGYVLAEDIIAGDNIPSFDNSAMDGYAIQAADTAGAGPENARSLKLIDEQPAGAVSELEVVAGTAIKVMTGAPLPAGADTVIPVEKTTEVNSSVNVLQEMAIGTHVRRAGEDMARGQLVLSSGSLLGAVDVGLLASLGKPHASVIRKPSVAVIGTGNELVDVDQPLAKGKIRDSNSYMLLAQAAACGAIPTRLGVARDTKEAVAEMLERALSCDVVVTSGGVSVGEYDFVKDVLAELGAEQRFWGVKQKPGKPMAFWTLRGKPVFGLPGNPTASAICFEEYVRPALLKMMGRAYVHRQVVEGILTEDYKKKAGRIHFIGMRVERRDGQHYASVNGRQGSGILKSLSRANGIGVLPKDATLLEKGQTIAVQLLDVPEDH